MTNLVSLIELLQSRSVVLPDSLAIVICRSDIALPRTLTAHLRNRQSSPSQRIRSHLNSFSQCVEVLLDPNENSLLM
jgi:hypothetical protein